MAKYPNANVEGVRAKSRTGEFEVSVNGKMVHSKLETNQFPNMGEMMKVVESSQ